MITKIQAILSLVPNAEVNIREEQIEWLSPSIAPVTDEEINAEIVRLEAEYNAKIKWIIGEDENYSAIYGDTQLITWQQLQEHSDEAVINIKLDLVRIERNRLLKETDWWACSDREITEPQKAYRQALRDITNGLDTAAKVKTKLVIEDGKYKNFPTKP